MSIILNGEVCTEEKVIADNGFFFGMGVFETILVTDKPVFLKEHLERLNIGLKTLGIQKVIDERYLLDNFALLKVQNCALKLTVTEKNNVLSAREINYREEQYAKGFKVKVSSVARNKNSHVVYLKSTNYGDNLIERNNWLKKGFDEVIFLNNEGYITEGSVSNIFFIKNGKIYTPAVNCGLLDGIIRSWIISNFEIKEGDYTIDDIINSDGVFITNSLLGIMKVDTIDDLSIKDNKMIDSIRQKYLAAVANN